MIPDNEEDYVNNIKQWEEKVCLENSKISLPNARIDISEANDICEITLPTTPQRLENIQNEQPFAKRCKIMREIHYQNPITTCTSKDITSKGWVHFLVLDLVYFFTALHCISPFQSTS